MQYEVICFEISVTINLSILDFKFVFPEAVVKYPQAINLSILDFKSNPVQVLR